MGKVRPEKVKKIARELVKRYPDQFSADFDSNKKLLNSIVTIYSSKLRNQIAGYVTRLVAISKAAQEEKIAEAAEEDVEEGKEETE